MNVKQVILVRKDIKMSKGKLAAQVAHASMGAILKLLRSGEIHQRLFYSSTDKDNRHRFVCDSEYVQHWLDNSFTKICLAVPDLATMQHCHRLALQKNIPTSFIIDEGRTCFSEPTATCCSIGPWDSDQIDEITGDFKLL